METLKKIFKNKFVHILGWILVAVSGVLLILRIAEVEIQSIVRILVAISMLAISVPAVWVTWEKFHWLKRFEDGDKKLENTEIMVRGIMVSALTIAIALIIGYILEGSYLGNLN